MPRVIAAHTLPFKHTAKLKYLYEAVRKRCTEPSDKAWEYYGGRGIRMCAEWLSDRRAFYAWCEANGYEPGLWIERNDVNGDYEPGNCRFATIAEQMNNKRNSRFLDWNGERMTFTQWERRLGFPRNLIHGRIARGWTVERSMTAPYHPRQAAA